MADLKPYGIDQDHAPAPWRGGSAYFSARCRRALAQPPRALSRSVSAAFQPASRDQGAPPPPNWLLGDLHTTFQTAILDGEFNFVDGLLGRGRDGGSEAPGAASAAMSYAEESVGDDGLPVAALGYAGEGSRALAMAPFLKAPPLAERGVWTAWSRLVRPRRLLRHAGELRLQLRSGGGTAGLDYREGDWLAGFAAGYSRPM